MKLTDKYAYSFDKERYYEGEYDSVEEAFMAAKEEAKNYPEGIEDVYIGRICKFVPVVDAARVIERLQDDACDEANECSEDYLDCITGDEMRKLEAMLTETFNQWAAETHNEPILYIVKEIQEYSLED